MLIMFGTLFICLVLTAPMAVSIGLSALTMIWANETPTIVLAQRMFSAVDSAPLLAIPFFVLAGSLMKGGGISQRLVKFADACVGGITGGLSIVAILASMFFAAISGSGPATTAAIGSIMIPAMLAKGYNIKFVAATEATAGQLGVIIPPSIPFVIFGLATGVSIGDLFMAGVMPGILIGCSLILVAYCVAKTNGYKPDRPLPWRERWEAFKESVWALFMPVLILGGIYKGIFTPTESAVVASAYALFVGAFVYKELKLKDLFPIFAETIVLVSKIMIIISAAGIFAYILTIYRIPHLVGNWFISITDSKIIFLLIVNLLLLIVGMFFDTTPAIVVLAPILMPVATSLGIAPLHMGVIIVCNLAIGFITPPFGVNLFVASQLTGLRVEQMGRYLLMYIGVLVVDILMISYIPAISLWLPSLLMR